jgi:small subunit ribosomal protein S20
MANIKSQIKRDRTNELARERNNTAKATARTALKKVEVLVAAGKKEDAEKARREAVALLDRLAQGGAVSTNSAARKKAHLAHIVAAVK